ncbi:tripartite tricarboxylate transporter substrate binding protein [Marinovum sp. 2_MG-2023]|uniref:tripartite tricarboxylate transporter substrate binding protein n=1 Tax=unclassified Marinovum TaxID=2647166 RepID=UPI0026E415EB|nr:MULTISPECIES: tripartite tricarboxylate transporter substrate binding protein [unclassified Marinovum]MDO6730982.1 tripartite tricarboxylate transporter substrate binding protein [Marinovum sp. 2_MG-2023]MDO6780209.1 tripartite tricarboxylate transporter substrate binding protein [Marinovum sp. 1_MG-2023]
MRSTFTAALAAAVVGLGAQAQAEYPEKPVKIIIPFGVGGSTTAIVRSLAEYLESALGEDVVITNVNGAGGSVGLIQAMKAKPDGYTIGMYADNLPVAMALGQSRPQIGDYVPACMIAKLVLGLAVRGDGGDLETLGALNAQASDSPGDVGMAIGLGTLAQFAGQAYINESGADLRLVNVGDGAAKLASVIGGHVPATIAPVAGLMGAHRGNQVKIVAVMHDERLDFLPDVPTVGEEIGTDVAMANSLAFVVPPETPESVIDTFCSAVKEAGEDPEFAKKMYSLGVTWSYREADGLTDYIRETEAAMSDIGASLKEK